MKHLAIVASLGVLVMAAAAGAEEGGTGPYLPGAAATLIDLAPIRPGLVVQPLFLNYRGDGSSSRGFPIAGQIAGDLDVTIDALTLGGLYTFEPRVLGARFTVAGFVPWVRSSVTAEVTVETETPGGPVSRTRKRSDEASGLGDVVIIPAMMAWEAGAWQFNAFVPIIAPTGSYERGRLANVGLNYWTADPTVGVSYSNEQTGFLATSFAGMTFNTENNATDYRSGSMFHLEASIQQLLPLGPGLVGLGVNGFLLEQVTGDSGDGATQGNFKGRSIGIGPVLSYVLPVGENSVVAEFRWLPELDTRNRVEGDYIWLKVVVEF